MACEKSFGFQVPFLRPRPAQPEIRSGNPQIGLREVQTLSYFGGATRGLAASFRLALSAPSIFLDIRLEPFSLRDRMNPMKTSPFPGMNPFIEAHPLIAARCRSLARLATADRRNLRAFAILSRH